MSMSHKNFSWKEFKEQVDARLSQLGLSENTELELIEVYWPDKEPDVYTHEERLFIID